MATGAVICAEIFHPDRYATPRFREARINGVDKILYFPEYDAFRVNIQWPNHSLSVFVQAGDQVAQAPDGNIEPAGDEEIAGDEETTDDEETFGNEETAIDEETGGNGVQLHRRNRRDFSVLPDFLSELWKRLTQTTVLRFEIHALFSVGRRFPVQMGSRSWLPHGKRRLERAGATTPER